MYLVIPMEYIKDTRDSLAVSAKSFNTRESSKLKIKQFLTNTRTLFHSLLFYKMGLLSLCIPLWNTDMVQYHHHHERDAQKMAARRSFLSFFPTHSLLLTHITIIMDTGQWCITVVAASRCITAFALLPCVPTPQMDVTGMRAECLDVSISRSGMSGTGRDIARTFFTSTRVDLFGF